MNLFTTGKLTNTRASTVSAFGFAGDTATKFEKDGQVYMNIRDANGGVGVDLCIDGSTMESIQDDIISTGFLVKRLGYTQTLAPHGWEGFVKTNSDGSVSRIPLTWSKKDSLWYFKYGFGPTKSARSGTDKAATVEMRPAGSSPRWGAGADKASSSAVAGGMSGMLRGPAKLAKLAELGPTSRCIRMGSTGGELPSTDGPLGG
jgi:hypothetical protein